MYTNSFTTWKMTSTRWAKKARTTVYLNWLTFWVKDYLQVHLPVFRQSLLASCLCSASTIGISSISHMTRGSLHPWSMLITYIAYGTISCRVDIRSKPELPFLHTPTTWLKSHLLWHCRIWTCLHMDQMTMSNQTLNSDWLNPNLSADKSLSADTVYRQSSSTIISR